MEYKENAVLFVYVVMDGRQRKCCVMCIHVCGYGLKTKKTLNTEAAILFTCKFIQIKTLEY